MSKEKGVPVELDISRAKKKNKTVWPYFAAPALLFALLASLYFVYAIQREADMMIDLGADVHKYQGNNHGINKRCR